MAINFSGAEILEIAINIEENGEKFYRDAARGAKKDIVRELFTFLADEEVRHKKYFQTLKDLAASKTEALFDPYLNEASIYIKALADAEVFTMSEEGKKFAKGIKDEKETLNFAIDREKDAIILYYELQKAIREKDKPVIEKIINEEKEHLKKLTSLRKDLFGKQW